MAMAAAPRVLVFEAAPRGRSTDMVDDVPGEHPGAPEPGLRERESEILGKIRAGEPEAFEYFVRTYQRKVFRLVYTLVRNAGEADALTQDIFVKAWRAVPDFKGEAAFETWLNRIAVNAVRDSARRRKPVVSFADLVAAEDADGNEIPRAVEPTDGTSPERDALSGQIRRRIGQALEALSPRQRAIFVMKHYEERSIAEIGAATGLDDGTVKSHLFRAARKLRQKLEDLR
jgi:RNA polymerase sigma-70 factor (ECF subfamily)